MWISSEGRKSKVIRKDFGDDLASARKLFLKAHDAGKRAATLACVNMGFPPPVELRPHTVRKRGRSARTGKKKVVTVEVDPLKDLNVQGKLWCPYCLAVRPFVLRKSFRAKGMRLEEPKYRCPICGVPHTDHHVRVWNPTADIHMTSSLAAKTRGPRKNTARRRRRRRA